MRCHPPFEFKSIWCSCLFAAFEIVFIGCEHKQVRPEVVRPVLSIVAAHHRGSTNGYSGTIEPRYHTDLGFRALGRIVARDVNVGDSVNAGQTVVSIASPDLREAVVDLGEDVVAALAIGAEFQVVLQNGGTIETIGQVREIAPQADATTRTRRVRIAISNPPDSFRLSATIAALSKVALQTNIRLPISAILESDGSSFVWVVDQANKKVHRVSVDVLTRNDQGVEIAKGIEPGDRVVTAGVHSLTDGQPTRWNRGDM